jgi:nitroreductase
MINDLIDAAVHAPTAVNQQPWTFTVVRNQTVLARISDGKKPSISLQLVCRSRQLLLVIESRPSCRPT